MLKLVTTSGICNQQTKLTTSFDPKITCLFVHQYFSEPLFLLLMRFFHTFPMTAADVLRTYIFELHFSMNFQFFDCISTVYSRDANFCLCLFLTFGLERRVNLEMDDSCFFTASFSENNKIEKLPLFGKPWLLN